MILEPNDSIKTMFIGKKKLFVSHKKALLELVETVLLTFMMLC